MTVYSRQQLTSLIKQYRDTGKIKWYPCRSSGFSTTYDKKDIQLLVEMDARFDDIADHTIKKLCESAYHQNEQEYQSLANISVSPPIQP